MRQPTLDEIKAYQKETGEGIAWCKAELTKQCARQAIRNLPHKNDEHFEDELKHILMYLVK